MSAVPAMPATVPPSTVSAASIAAAAAGVATAASVTSTVVLEPKPFPAFVVAVVVKALASLLQNKCGYISAYIYLSD